MDHTILRKNGYSSHQAYIAGNINGSEFHGWVGEKGKDPANLMKELSMFKNPEDCPQVMASLFQIGINSNFKYKV